MRIDMFLGVIVAITLFGLGCSDEPSGGSSDGDADGDTDGDTDSDSDVDTDEPIPFTEMCDAFIQDACKAIFTCPSVGNYFDYKDEAACREDLPCRGYGDLEVSIEQGWFAYDAAAMGSCHAFILSDLCGAAVNLPSDSIQGVLLLCPDVIQGNQVPGDPCMDLADCSEGSYCSITDQCPGVCIELVESGGACDEALEAPDMSCNEFNNVYCIGGICRQLLAQGETCLGYESYCGPGLMCNSRITEISSPTCIPLGTSGDVCESNSDCVDSLVCLPTNGDTESFQCGEPLSLGEYCEWNSQCGLELSCVNDVCVLSPVLGEPCTEYFFGGDNCADGFICEGEQCLTAKYIGESCGEEMEGCAESWCDQGVCAERLPDGVPCNSGYECHSRSCAEVCYDSYLCDAQIETK